MTYAEKLQDPRWQKKRLQVLERDRWTCKICGDTESTLHVHHFTYKNNPWESDLEDLTTYCKHCHSIIEFNKKQNETIRPYKVLKYDMDGFIKLILLYIDKDKQDCIDIYKYANEKIEYLTSLSFNTISRINHFFTLVNDF